MPQNDIKRKPARITNECDTMLREATAYIAENSMKQAEILNTQFLRIIKILEIFPEIGTSYKKRMRRIKLGKFRYNIYYRIQKGCVKIVGIWHTSRGTEFKE